MIKTELNQKRYQRLYKQLEPLLVNSPSTDAQLATINAVIYHKVPYIFWVGFYLLKNNRLIIGPYQGPLACQELKYPHGVCWYGIMEGKSVIVPDVSKFPNHIACDSRSKSELVIPLWNNQKQIIGVFDVDSTLKNAFNSHDQEGLERIINLLTNSF